MTDLPSSFHPVIRSWFAETYGKATAVQAAAWPLIERGEHVLALAPTGSGKTLTAFLSAISRFCLNDGDAGQYPVDKLAVLYVSPLKALNEDIRRNLLEPLAAIKSRFETEGLSFPDIRVETRSGDTPQSQRRRFIAHPPSILALTPESLAILLLNPNGRRILAAVKYLILDEIHAVLGNKRGSFLSCQVDRLSLIAGEFQRISLSATIRSPQTAAKFVGGLNPQGQGRAVSIAAPLAEKQIKFDIAYPAEVKESDQIEKYGKRYTGLINYILNRISDRSTILVFTDSRRRAERLCYFLNQEAALQETRLPETAGGPVAFAHHGSLSKELRQSVERRLAEGSLPCVVATASLELGIDIGSVDEVVLAGSPGSVSQALQRVGRSGHGVGMVSRGRLFPFHGMDLLLAAALKGAVEDRDIEELRPIENPLDILAQMILALCTEKTRNIDELYTLLKKFYIFRNLNRDSYERTVRMLAGLGVKGRLREIKPRIWLDSITGEIGALEGSLLLLYSSGGVIANRGQYSLRLASGSAGNAGSGRDAGTKIGELDEEFVWERRLGDRFNFGGRGWRITGIEAESVLVTPLDTSADFIPFWHADTVFRSPILMRRVLSILDSYNARTTEGGGFSETAGLGTFLDSQSSAQGGIPLACSSGMTVEIIDSPVNHGDFYAAVIHSFRGGAVNYPLALALSQELEETLQMRVETFSDDNALFFLIPRRGGGQPEDILRSAFVSLNRPGGGGLCRGERLFRNRLETSGVFGANFREAAERSLLLPRTGFGRRTPLWITRQRSKRLFDAVSRQDGFPVTAEAWRSCLNDMFDMDGFCGLLGAINDGSIAISFFRTSDPSPFSQDMVRQETNSLMYEYDERKDLAGIGADRSATLSDRVIREALGDAALRPALQRKLADDFTARLRRELAGWAPEDMLSLREWVKERVAVPLDEWEALVAALPEKLKQEISPLDSNEYLKTITREGAAIASVVHREWEEMWKGESLTLLGPWLRYEGPVSLQRIAEVFGVSPAAAEGAVNALVEVDEAVSDVTLESDAALICDAENLELLLRLSRRKARPIIKEYPAALLIPFLAIRQGVAAAQPSAGDNAAFLKKLDACSAPAKLWETEFCAARLGSYSPEIIDREIQEGRLVWYGAGKERIGLCRPDNFDLVFSEAEPASPARQKKPRLSAAPVYAEAFGRSIESDFFDRPRDFWEIKEEMASVPAAGQAGIGSKDCAQALWQQVWQGRLSSDSLEPVRLGLESGFVPEDTQIDEPKLRPAAYSAPRRPRVPRSLRDRWRGGAPVRGKWFSLIIDNPPADNEDPWLAEACLDEECRNRDRVRLLLERWGILCRPLLERESAPFNWSALLPAMRRMELAGELVTGRFFAGINSLQFASPAVAAELEYAESFDGMYWMNAADPASPAGLEIEGLDSRLPSRVPSSRICFRGAQLAAVSNRNGRDQRIFVMHDDPCIAALIDFIKIPRTRKVLPDNNIVIETINGGKAAQSEYAPVFQNAGFVPDRGRLCFW